MSKQIATPRSTDLGVFDPDKATKTIAVAEAAEKYYRRAKDPKRLFEAIEAKLTNQRDFVLWWDQQEKDKGGHASLYARDGSVTGTKLANFNLDKKTVSRWRKRLADKAAFERHIDAIRGRVLNLLECGKSDAEYVVSSEFMDWQTPKEYVDAAREVMGGIDLDPASCEVANKTVQADKFYDPEQDGLSQKWAGRVWLNPPYGKACCNFVNKLIDEFHAGDVTEAVLLVNGNSFDVFWFHPLFNYTLCFTDHRIKFISEQGGDSGPTHGSCFVYFGPDEKAVSFATEFDRFGHVVRRWGAVTT
jgi:hypothetical protein